MLDFKVEMQQIWFTFQTPMRSLQRSPTHHSGI